MKFIQSTLYVLMLSFVAGLLVGCSDDESTAAKACLASAPQLSFNADDSSEKIVTVYSDGDWHIQAPEWVTVAPMTGSGTMDISVSVSKNYRDGAPDNPRKGDISISGDKLISVAIIVVAQDGDKYRDCEEVALADVNALTDESVLMINNAIVTAVTNKGDAIISDDSGSANVYVTPACEVSLEKGCKINLKGEKLTDDAQMAYMSADEITIVSSGNAVTYPEATDITANIDNLNVSPRQYIKVSGVVSQNNLTVKGASNKISFVNPVDALQLASMQGHNIVVAGYYCGTASPFVKIVVSEVLEDLGVAETVYFIEDFEWLAPHAEASDAGDTVGKDDPNQTSPQISASATSVGGLTAAQALEEKGYEFLRVTTKTEGECIYLQNNYLKMGKTSYQAGLILPAMPAFKGGKVPGLKMTFNWCSQRQGSGVIDPTELVVIAKKGDDENVITTLKHNFVNNDKLIWLKAEIDLSSVEIDKDTRIIIRNVDEQWPIGKAMRWFIDDIKISSPE